MKLIRTIYVFVLCAFALSAQAWTPRANINTVGLFLSGSGYELPSTYFQQQTLSKYEGGTDNYVLKTTPTNASGGTQVNLTGQWNSSSLALNPAWYSVFLTGFASFTEPTINRGQCVAFAKVATQSFTTTPSWKAGDWVIPQVSQYLYSDTSSQHAGKMVAFFGTNAAIGDQYPQSSSSPGHVGIFLKYAYNRVIPPYQIIGFWIADENYEGTPAANNPDGKIRKHLLLINPVANASGQRSPHTYGSQYHFVNIQ